MVRKLSFILFFFLVSLSLVALPFDNRITLPDGRRVFVTGFNLAWINYANDVGDMPLDERRFRKAAQDIASAGGNTIRVWLSTNGSRDPKFGADGWVSGLGSKTIANVKRMLEIARENDLFLMPVLLTHNFLQASQGANLAFNRKMLTTDQGLALYIDRALIPLVKAVGDNPNLLCWEIANEAEGMVEFVGWTAERITKYDVQRFTNRMAGAIKRTVPGVLVSTGTVSADKLDWYSDAALVKAGGDDDGTLDFYMIHYYGWNGPSVSPFANDAESWSVDKPIVVGEMPSSSWSPETRASNRLRDSGDVNELLRILYDSGYAGGLYWQYQRDGGDPWLRGFASAGPALRAFVEAHSEDPTLAVSIK
jgi:hypothetical protein